MIDSIYTQMQCCRLMIFLIITNSSYKTGRQGYRAMPAACLFV